MAVTAAQFESQIDAFLDKIRNSIVSEVSNSDLPLIGAIGTVAEKVGGVDTLDPFAALKAEIHDALTQAQSAGGSLADALVVKLNEIPGVTAAVSAGGDISLAFNTTVTAETEDFNIAVDELPIFKINASGNADFSAKLQAQISINSDGTFTMVDGAPEVEVGIGASFSIQDTEADLGLAKIEVDDADPTKDEFTATFKIDVDYNGTTFSATPTVVADVGLDLKFETTF
ncbi:MAG: hypothetical protein EPO45_20585, partial [Sphingobium sp.]